MADEDDDEDENEDGDFWGYWDIDICMDWVIDWDVWVCWLTDWFCLWDRWNKVRNIRNEYVRAHT